MNTADVRRSVAFAAVLIMMATRAGAQERLTLDDAVRMSLQQNRQLRSATEDVEAARWGRLNAFTNFLPRVELSAGITRIDPESETRANAAIDFIKASAGVLGIPESALSEIKPFAYRDTYASDITVVQPIYNGGAEIVGVQAADALSDRSVWQQADTQQDVIARVKSTYYAVLKTEELVALAHEAATRTQKHLEMTRRRADVGQRTRTDVLRWEVQLAADEGAVVNAENGLAATRLQLNEVLGADLNATFQLVRPGTLDSSSAALTGPARWNELASLTGAAERLPSPDPALLDAHPSMRMMEANLRLADVNISKSWVNFKPRINAAFQYGWEKNNTLSLDGIRPWALALQVSWPIFNSFGDYTNLEKANAEYRRTEAQVETFRRGLSLQASVASLAVRSAQKRIEIARKGQDESLDVLNAVTRRYETGGASNVDLIDVQTAHTSARANYISAVYDYLIADVQLARANGTLAP